MSTSGNRHLRPDPEGRFKSLREGNRSVLIKADPDYARTPACQHLLQMLANSIARQYGVVEEILIDVPSCQVHPNIFLLNPADQDLRQALSNLITIVGGTEINCRIIYHNENTAAQVLVGPCASSNEARFSISVTADGWRFACSNSQSIPSTKGRSSNPVGPYIGACFAAAAIFKYFFETDATTDIFCSLWDYTEGDWEQLSEGIEPEGALPKPVYLIGAGAVGTACAFTLAAVSKLEGLLIPIDPQNADKTNRNRLLSCPYNAVGQPKVELLNKLFNESTIQVVPYQGLWPDYTADPERHTPTDVQQIERADKFEWVLSGVDKNIHRRAISQYLPRHVIGGSTNGMIAQVAYYSMTDKHPCLACYHPVPKIIPTEELAEALKVMSFAERSEWYERRDANNEAIAAMEEYLKDPNCGTVGQAELARLGREGETDWAVGFVSIAAGVLQAALLVKSAVLGVQDILNRQNEFFVWFWKSGIGQSNAQPKPGCNICNNSERQKRYKHKWSL